MKHMDVYGNSTHEYNRYIECIIQFFSVILSLLNVMLLQPICSSSMMWNRMTALNSRR